MKYGVHVPVYGLYQVHWKGITTHGETEREALLKLAEHLEQTAKEFREWAEGLTT